MATLRAWFIEEIDLGGGNIGHRQTHMTFDSVTGDWIRPDERLHPGASTTWDNVMTALQDLCGSGKDRRWIVNPVHLMDFCNNLALARNRRKLGTGDQYTEPNE
jgi:hypothetical protein